MLTVMNNTVPITAQLVEQRLEHQVTDEAAAASRSSHRYQALCGQLFIAAPLAAPSGRPCPDCIAALAAVPRPAALAAPHRKRHGLTRLLRLTRSSFLAQGGER